MHIGLICNEYPPCNHGGIGSFTRDLATALVMQGCQVTVIGVYHGFVEEFLITQDYFSDGVRVIKIPYKNYSVIRRFAGFINRNELRKTIRSLHHETPFDLLEAPEFDGWLPIKPVATIPIVTRLHSGVVNNAFQFNHGYSRMSGFFEKQQVKNSDKIIAVSNHIGIATQKVLDIQFEFHVIYNCVRVNTAYQNNIEINKGMILYFGTIAPKKGLTQLFQALPEIMRGHTDAKLVLAGKNNTLINNIRYEDILRSLIPDEIQHKVSFAGMLNREDELYPLIRNAQVCCFPSLSEAFALAPMEAMAFGKPVVFTKYASGPELIKHGVTGLLADTKEPTDIAEKVLVLLNNPVKAKSLGLAAYKVISERFNYKAWVNQNIEMYRSIISVNSYEV